MKIGVYIYIYVDISALRTTFGSLYRDYVFIKPVEVVGVFVAASLLQLVSQQLSNVGSTVKMGMSIGL